MLKKTVTYENFDGEMETKDFWFNLNKVELADFEADEPEGFKTAVEKAVEEHNTKEIIRIFKKILLTAYGVRTAEGGFKKSAALREAFEEGPAYPEIFMELASDEAACRAFVEGVMPKNLKQVANQ